MESYNQCSSWSFRPSGIKWNVKRPAPHPKDMPIPPNDSVGSPRECLQPPRDIANLIQTGTSRPRMPPTGFAHPHTFCGSGVVFATTRSFQEPVIIWPEQMIVSLVPPVALIGQSNWWHVSTKKSILSSMFFLVVKRT